MSAILPENAKVYISTNGCVEAQLSTRRIEKFANLNNIQQTKRIKDADLIIFYACGLTEYSEKKSVRIIKNLKNKKRLSANLIVWGCLPKQNPDALASVYAGPIIGAQDIDYFIQILGKTHKSFEGIEAASSDKILRNCAESSWITESDVDPLTNILSLSKQYANKLLNSTQKEDKIYYIRVATGCTGNCTYCSEYPVFGRIQSRSIENILSEFNLGVKEGYSKFSLLATDLGAYGMDVDSNLCVLLKEIINHDFGVDYSLILNQIEPNNLSKIFPCLEEVLSSGKIEGLMCPVQSGSNRILKTMGRKYSIEEWKNYMIKIRRDFPNIRLSTHFMVGFPSETEEDFNETKKLLDPPLEFDDITVFKYSERPTVTSRNISGQIPEEIKETRRQELLKKFQQSNKIRKKTSPKRIEGKNGFVTDSGSQ